MGERFRTRAVLVTAALRSRLGRPTPDRPPRRILVSHNLLLGDTLMITPLLAKLRRNHPGADIAMLVAPSFVPLYANRPYGVRALPFSPANAALARDLLREPPFDLAFVAGDNRYSWPAGAMGARHVVAHHGDPSWAKNFCVDEQRPYSPVPRAWGEMVSDLADGEAPAPYAPGDWPRPECKPFEIPKAPYAVLHLGASSRLKHWPADRWRALAAALQQRGLSIAWSAGAREEALVREVDPDGRFPNYAGRLELTQVWRLLEGAALLVAPDTGVAHLGRVSWTPTVALFGPGSIAICQPGDFWSRVPWRGVTAEDFPCRDQQMLFGREIPWVMRCRRTPAECPKPLCMEAIGVEPVLTTVDSLLASSSTPDRFPR